MLNFKTKIIANNGYIKKSYLKITNIFKGSRSAQKKEPGISDIHILFSASDLEGLEIDELIKNVDDLFEKYKGGQVEEAIIRKYLSGEMEFPVFKNNFELYLNSMTELILMFIKKPGKKAMRYGLDLLERYSFIDGDKSLKLLRKLIGSADEDKLGFVFYLVNEIELVNYERLFNRLITIFERKKLSFEMREEAFAIIEKLIKNNEDMIEMLKKYEAKHPGSKYEKLIESTIKRAQKIIKRNYSNLGVTQSFFMKFFVFLDHHGFHTHELLHYFHMILKIFKLH